MEDKLRTHLADNMVKRGRVIAHLNQSNEYAGVDKYLIVYRSCNWWIVYVDGMACEIQRLD